MTLELPADSLIGIRIPPKDLERELLRRLAVALFSDGVLPSKSACCMAGMSKTEFQYMLGERGISQPAGDVDYEQELSNLAAWRGHQ